MPTPVLERPVRRLSQPAQQRPPVRSRAVRWCQGLSAAYLAVVCLVWVVLALVSERWWLGTVFVYLPRSPWMFPAFLLTALSCRFSPLSIAVNAVTILVVAGPVMNYQARSLVSSPAIDDTRPLIRVLSCNIQGFRPHFPDVVAEIQRIDPDVIAFQEVFNDHELVEELFAEWNVQRVDEYLVASRWPLKHLETCYVAGFDRVTATRFEVTSPDGVFEIVNVHQTSPRRSLTGLSPWTFVTGDGLERLERHTVLRDIEADKTRECVDRVARGRPVVVVGDFNMPTDSSLFQQHWGDLTDAYATSTTGYGYTSPCGTQKLWPANTPWAQVDHILASRDWQIQRCWTGHSAGSDHRLMAAILRLPPTRPSTK